MPCQRQNVFASFLQWRQPKDPAANPVVQIMAKMAFFDAPEQIPVGGGNETKLAALPDIAANTFIGALLNDTQKLRLQVERRFAHLVKKKRSTVRVRERAVACADSSGERAAFWPKNSLPDNSGVMVVQSTMTRSFLARRSSSWTRRATCSLPVPLSPISSTAALVNRATSTIAAIPTAMPGFCRSDRCGWPATATIRRRHASARSAL